jgi:hypothetical protein
MAAKESRVLAAGHRSGNGGSGNAQAFFAQGARLDEERNNAGNNTFISLGIPMPLTLSEIHVYPVKSLRTLSRYRRQGNKVYFGQNLLHEGIGRLSLGEKVEVLGYATD